MSRTPTTCSLDDKDVSGARQKYWKLTQWFSKVAVRWIKSCLTFEGGKKKNFSLMWKLLIIKSNFERTNDLFRHIGLIQQRIYEYYDKTLRIIRWRHRGSNQNLWNVQNRARKTAECGASLFLQHSIEVNSILPWIIQSISHHKIFSFHTMH